MKAYFQDRFPAWIPDKPSYPCQTEKKIHNTSMEILTETLFTVKGKTRSNTEIIIQSGLKNVFHLNLKQKTIDGISGSFYLDEIDDLIELLTVYKQKATRS